MSTTQDAIKLLLHRRLVQDYSWLIYIALYESEIDCNPLQVEPFPQGPPPVPPNTPVPSPPPSPPPSPKVNGIH